MRIFVTGATGFIGSAIVQELIGAGHQVLGLARSDSSAQALVAAGAEVQRGDLDDLDSLRSGASASDAVIHAGFIHDFSDFAGACETDRRAIEALGEALVGSDRPFVVTSGTALITPGRLATEDDATVLTFDKFPRVASEEAASAVAGRGVRVSVVFHLLCMARAIVTVSFRFSSRLHAKRVCQPMSATGAIVGRRCIVLMQRIFSGWRWKKELQARGITA